MQKNILFSLVVLAYPISAQPLQGDVYFEQNNFPAAYRVYDSLFQTGTYTPRMLLRMAHIKRRDPFLSLYWLNVYLFQTGDKRILKQIQNLSQKYDVPGHTYSDLDFFRNLYQRFNIHIITLLGVLLLLILALSRKRVRRFSLILSSLILVVLLLGLNNLEFKVQYALTNQDDVKIYASPSPAALNIGKLNKGSRVVILNEEGTWSSVLWREKIAFIHRQELRNLP